MHGGLKKINAPIEAAFKFVDYKFTEASINLGNLNENDNLTIVFSPSGVYNPKNGIYKLHLGLVALAEESKEIIIEVNCVADFSFITPLELADLPPYFYANTTAIIYPYIRAFVSTLSVQANYNSIVLPTLNISALADELKANTEIDESLGE